MTNSVFRNNLIWSLELKASWERMLVWIQFSGYQFTFLHHKLGAVAEWGHRDETQSHESCLLEAPNLVRRHRHTGRTVTECCLSYLLHHVIIKHYSISSSFITCFTFARHHATPHHLLNPRNSPIPWISPFSFCKRENYTLVSCPKSQSSPPRTWGVWSQ